MIKTGNRGGVVVMRMDVLEEGHEEIFDIEAGEEECIYSDDFRVSLVDNDEISPEEEGFMKGYGEEIEE